jgi:hypothetical protein
MRRRCSSVNRSLPTPSCWRRTRFSSAEADDKPQSEDARSRLAKRDPDDAHPLALGHLSSRPERTTSGTPDTGASWPPMAAIVACQLARYLAAACPSSGVAAPIHRASGGSFLASRAGSILGSAEGRRPENLDALERPEHRIVEPPRNDSEPGDIEHEHRRGRCGSRSSDRECRARPAMERVTHRAAPAVFFAATLARVSRLRCCAATARKRSRAKRWSTTGRG